MSVWLTPDLKPFLGGTYFPPENRYGRAGFPAVLERVADAWRTDRQRIVESSAEVLAHLKQAAEVAPAGGVDPNALQAGFLQFRAVLRFDVRRVRGCPEVSTACDTQLSVALFSARP